MSFNNPSNLSCWSLSCLTRSFLLSDSARDGRCGFLASSSRLRLISSCFWLKSRASCRILRICSANWLEAFLRRSSRISFRSFCARVPEATAWDNWPCCICLAACFISCRVCCNCCRCCLVSARFSGRSMRWLSSSKSSRLRRCSSRRLLSCFSISFFSAASLAARRAFSSSFSFSFKSS